MKESIESILDQTFTDWEFIIIDDGSTDNTWSILTEYAEKDQRIKLDKNKENIGLTKTLNKGIKLAKGEYIARQDADDVSLPTRFEKQVNFLQKNPETVLLSCNIEVINPEGTVSNIYEPHCESELVPWFLLFHNHLGGHSQVMFRKSPTLDIGGYRDEYRYSQDYELWCRLIKVGEIAILPEVLLQQRFHANRISSMNNIEQENFALSQSQKNIQTLIGEEISLEEIKNLQGFWQGHRRQQCFPNSAKAKKIHVRLKQIKQKFLQQNINTSHSNILFSRKLNHHIGKQFLSWIQVVPLSRKHNLLEKLKISFYALRWCPLKLLNIWSKLGKKWLLGKLSAIFRICVNEFTLS